ncbi:MAG: FAD-dependent oxidoreductase [Actinomycetes bacterium]
MNIAIIGTGISGLVCAHLLHPHHALTVFEANDYIGGHTNTVRIDLPSPNGSAETHQVDTGFIVFNDRNYPNFSRLLETLGVASQPSEMSFSVSDPRIGLEYRGTNINTLFAQRINLTKPWFYRLLADILRFNRSARKLVDQHRLSPAVSTGPTLAEFLSLGNYSSAFVERFIIPLGASIWSADPETFTEFPALSYAEFMNNHGLLELSGMPQWRTVSGGSKCYVDALTAPFHDRIRLNAPIKKVVRHVGESTPSKGGGVEVLGTSGPSEYFDHVIIASHSDQALRLLSDSSDAEREILGAIRYQPNVATLHTDARLLPKTPRARASWNYHLGSGTGRRSTLTYWMNRLQSIQSDHQVLVTLNRHDDIDPDTILGRYEYDHPVFDAGSIAAQLRRDDIQGQRNTYFAGAYWGHGFHEDGVQSALDVCRHFGVTL